MSKEPPAIVACLPTSWGPAGISGARAETCADCGQPVWVAPSTDAAVADLVKQPAPLVCLPCVQKRLNAAPALARFGPIIITEPQLRELEQATGVRGDEIIRRLRRTFPGARRKED